MNLKSKLTLMIFFAVTSPRLFAQSNKVKPIEYLTPDTVKEKIREALKNDKHKPPYYVAWNTNGDTTSLLVSSYDSNDVKISELIKNSNRFVNLYGNQNIPVVLTSDFLFSTILHKLKNKGKKSEILNETSIGASGYIIEFTGTYYNSKLIKFEYYTN